MVEENSTLYIVEPLSNSFRVMYRLKRVLYSGKTRYQRVDIVESEDYGLTLLLDGLLQSSEIDEEIYHECLVHPVMVTHPNPRKVLVIGGGEGSTIREVEKHGTVEKIVMVDIDGELIEIVKKYIPWSRNSFEDKRLDLFISEGREFLENQSDGSFDIVILDLTDPVPGEHAAGLYTVEFYQTVYRKLRDEGLMVTQASSISHTPNTFLSILKTVENVFPRACCYGCYIKSFSSMWGYVVGSKSALPPDLGKEEVDLRLRERGVEDLKFYCGDVHVSLFKLIEVYLRFYKGEARILRDLEMIGR
ncbi:MAG: polyamine aminopropyltransferase [Nitrososphaerota archaeon]